LSDKARQTFAKSQSIPAKSDMTEKRPPPAAWASAAGGGFLKDLLGFLAALLPFLPVPSFSFYKYFRPVPHDKEWQARFPPLPPAPGSPPFLPAAPARP
jgi:hypothetical protein